MGINIMENGEEDSCRVSKVETNKPTNTMMPTAPEKEKASCKKLSHKKWRRLWKKEKRKQRRKELAKNLEKLEEEERIKNGLTSREAVIAKQKQDEWQQMLEEKKRKKLEEEWIAREKLAQEEFERKTKEIERRKQDRLDQEIRIKEEWEAQQKREKEQIELKEKRAKDRENELTQALEKSGIITSDSQSEQPWHNPIINKTGEDKKVYGTEQDPNNCSFFLKTGACRFGERCSRQHPRPEGSATLLIPNMFTDVRLTEVMLDEKDQDVGLEFDEDELYSNFKSFYNDVVGEFKTVGELYQFKVCSNFEPHLRGNVYVQYKSEEDALRAFAKFNGRWYAGKQLSVQFSPVNKWKSAICGTFARNRCPRGKNCNFLHVFRNPRNEFCDADRDLEPRDVIRSTRRSEREWRSSTRELERRWDREDSLHSNRSSHNENARSRRSRTKDHEPRTRSKSRERYRSRSRDRYDSRKRRRSRSGSRDRSSLSSKARANHRSRRKSRSQSRDRYRGHHDKSGTTSPIRKTKYKIRKKRTEYSSESNSSSENEEETSSYRSRKYSNKIKHRNSAKIENLKDSDHFEPEYDSD